MALSICCYTDSREFGGAENALLMLVRGLVGAGCRTMLVVHQHPGLEPLTSGAREAGVDVHVAAPLPLGLRGAFAIPRFAALLRRLRPDVFHAHQSAPLSGKWALTAAAVARVQAIFATVQLFPPYPLSRSSRVQLRLLARRVDRQIAVSDDARDHLVDLLGLPRHAVTVVPNAVEIDRFADIRSADPTGPVTVLVAARLHEQKGHRYLLEAAADLPQLRFVLAGDGPERAALEQLAVRRGIAERVVFEGFVDDVTPLMRESHIFALPSLYEGLPLSILEAMAAGRPVVATDIPGNRDAVVDGETGILVPVRNSRALADALRRLADDAGLRERLGRAGRSVARDRFSSDRLIEAYLALYESALRGAPAA